MTSTDEYRKVYEDLKSELFKRQLSNSENFDKAILAYSTASLGFSLAFLKDFVPITKAAHAWLLYASWWLFVMSVIVTLFSFLVSQWAIAKQLKINERYYLDRKDDALNDSNVFARITEWLNLLSGIAFVFAVMFTTLFVTANLENEATMFLDKKLFEQKGAPVPPVQRIPQSNDRQVPQQQPGQDTDTGTGSHSGDSSGSGTVSGTPPGSGMSGGSKQGNS
jgi:hypothetical protein